MAKMNVTNGIAFLGGYMSTTYTKPQDGAPVTLPQLAAALGVLYALVTTNFAGTTFAFVGAGVAASFLMSPMLRS